MTVILEAKNIQVQRGGKTVLKVDHLSVEEGEVLAVIGPNGAGKSTLLMVLSQLLQLQEGQLIFRGKPLDPKKTLAFRRKIGMVLQDPLLLDNSVFDNIATGLRFRGIDKQEIEKRVLHWLAQLDISELRNRRSRQISGGEAQRVSLARALALEPDILFLDEPFSALDTPTRIRLLSDFQSLLSNTTVTTIFVTHDLDEALLLGDRVAVILDGEIRQIDTPEKVFSAPTDPDIARFVGVETVIPGKVMAAEEGMIRVSTNGYQFEAVGEVRVRQEVLLCLRPEDVTLWTSAEAPHSSARNQVEGKISRITPQGPLTRVVVDCGFPLVALVTRTSAMEMKLEVGKKVVASFKASAVHLIGR
ncbi:MAG: ABC transporter ATP-binding protein [Anaerolineaceae bacterium]|jgi:tungstate transport system ATP-binding protein